MKRKSILNIFKVKYGWDSIETLIQPWSLTWTSCFICQYFRDLAPIFEQFELPKYIYIYIVFDCMR